MQHFTRDVVWKCSVMQGQDDEQGTHKNVVDWAEKIGSVKGELKF